MDRTIFHKLYNIIAIIVVIALTVYSFFKPIGLTPFIVAIAIYVVLYMLIMAIRKEAIFKIILFPLIGALASFGIMTTTLMVCNNLEQITIDSETKTLTEAIRTNATTYKEVFENNEYYFYVDRDYQNLLQINKDDLADLITYPIKASNEVSNDFSAFSPFYDISLFKNLIKTCSFDIHFAFMKNVEDNSLLVRLIIDENIYYTYVSMDNVNEYISNNEAFALLNKEGFTNFYITVSSYSVDYESVKNAEEGDEVTATQDTTGLLTVIDNGYYFSDAMYVEYQSDAPDYIKRVNNFYNRTVLDQIRDLNTQLSVINPEADEYGELQAQIDSLKSQTKEYYVELVNETITQEQSFRYYRTYIPTQETDAESGDVDFDVISIYEWEKDGQYFVAETSIDSYQLFDFSQYE